MSLLCTFVIEVIATKIYIEIEIEAFQLKTAAEAQRESFSSESLVEESDCDQHRRIKHIIDL